mmetsp:Transcript_10588/g.26291  ORF Transcript_10588/g.26291 Transcript_10588/m.26291 type:complete len:319 (-) Transcript_10588:617-1573(-)
MAMTAVGRLEGSLERVLDQRKVSSRSRMCCNHYTAPLGTAVAPGDTLTADWHEEEDWTWEPPLIGLTSELCTTRRGRTEASVRRVCVDSAIRSRCSPSLQTVARAHLAPDGCRPCGERAVQMLRVEPGQPRSTICGLRRVRRVGCRVAVDFVGSDRGAARVGRPEDEVVHQQAEVAAEVAADARDDARDRRRRAARPMDERAEHAAPHLQALREIGVVVVGLARARGVGSLVALVGRKLRLAGERDLQHEEGGRHQRLVLHAAVQQTSQVVVPVVAVWSREHPLQVRLGRHHHTVQAVAIVGAILQQRHLCRTCISPA